MRCKRRRMKAEYVVVKKEPESGIFLELHKSIMQEIFPFVVAFVIGNHPSGSGTFVSVGEYHGILTARHVADDLFAAPPDSLSLCIENTAHRLEIRLSQILHIPVGIPKNENGELPDLSFVQIVDKRLLRVIASKKAFYNLGAHSDDFLSFIRFFRRSWWFVSGSPKEFSRAIISSTAEKLMSISIFVGDATFATNSQQDTSNLDQVVVKVPIGGAFPVDYDGMSGGGVWLAPLMSEAESPSASFKPELILAGVIHSQLPPKSQHRILHANGPRSVFQRVPEALRRHHESKQDLVIHPM